MPGIATTGPEVRTHLDHSLQVDVSGERPVAAERIGGHDDAVLVLDGEDGRPRGHGLRHSGPRALHRHRRLLSRKVVETAGVGAACPERGSRVGVRGEHLAGGTRGLGIGKCGGGRRWKPLYRGRTQIEKSPSLQFCFGVAAMSCEILAYGEIAKSWY